MVVRCLNLIPKPGTINANRKDDCEGLIDVAKALNKKQITTQRGLWVVTQGTQSIQTKINPIASTLWGMVRSLRHEMVDMRCVCLDLDLAQLPENNAAAIVESLYSAKNIEQIAKTAEGIYTHSLEKVFTAPRLVLPESDYYHLIPADNKILHELKYAAFEPGTLTENEVEIQVEAVSLNFRDLAVAMGSVTNIDPVLGSDVVGIVTGKGTLVKNVEIGDRVFGLANASLGNCARTLSSMITQKPKDLTLFEAAALPTVYLMVDYCFSPWIRPLTANDTVLIHTAAGGVGLIAIAYANVPAHELLLLQGAK